MNAGCKALCVLNAEDQPPARPGAPSCIPNSKPAVQEGLHPATHFSSTTVRAPFAASCAAVDSPPMPLPMMTASYSTSCAGQERAQAGVPCVCGGVRPSETLPAGGHTWRGGV